jgi:chromosome segregation ATPase
MNSTQLSNKLNLVNLELAKLKGIKENIDGQVKSLSDKLTTYTEEIKIQKEAHLLMLAFISDRQEAGIKTIENTTTFALRSIYGDDRKLVFLKNEEKKTKAAFKMEIGIESQLNDGRVITGVKDERGGGVAEITATSIRLAVLDWLEYTGPVLFDETFRTISMDVKIHYVAKFLSQYVKAKQRQIIYSTHQADVFSDFADNIIYVTQENGISKTSTTP